jgi:hypothetical protein
MRSAQSAILVRAWIEAEEQGLIEKLVAHAAIEAFAEAVLLFREPCSLHLSVLQKGRTLNPRRENSQGQVRNDPPSARAVLLREAARLGHLFESKGPPDRN